MAAEIVSLSSKLKAQGRDPALAEALAMQRWVAREIQSVPVHIHDRRFIPARERIVDAAFPGLRRVLSEPQRSEPNVNATPQGSTVVRLDETNMDLAAALPQLRALLAGGATRPRWKP